MVFPREVPSSSPAAEKVGRAWRWEAARLRSSKRSGRDRLVGSPRELLDAINATF